MYNEYFGLTDAPFSISPDPRYLYMSDQHREALAHLVFGMNTGGGFILLTGEVGTGKTTVCRCLLEQVPDDANVALILNPKVIASELLATICDELGIEYPEGETSIKKLVDCINRYLLDEHARGRKTVVILEEAQNLDADVLEQLRLLTNLETNERKLLQIVMLGQPELLEMLAAPEMRQLSQRITARYHLKALSRKEIEAYVTHRLSVAGLKGTLFPAATLSLLYRLSNGIPRRINLLCDRALLGVYVQNRSWVDGKILKKAAKEVLGEEGSFASRLRARTIRLLGFSPWWLVVPTALILLVAFGLGALLGTDAPDPVKLISAQEQSKPDNVETSEPVKVLVPPKLVDQAPETTEIVPETMPEVLGKDKSLNIAEDGSAAIDEKVVSESGEKQSPLKQKDGVVLFDVLPEGLSAATSLEKAYSALLDAWKIGSSERVLDSCEYAKSNGLGCLFKQGNMRSVIHMNRPAVLKLFDTEGQTFYVALLGIQDDMADIVLDNKVYKVKVSELEENWFGEYTLIWKVPSGIHDGVIRFGDKGTQVLWLANKLVQAQGKTSGSVQSDVFDVALSKKLEVFQRSRGILPDSIAGAVTLIHLNSVTGQEIPLLKPELKPEQGDL